MSTKTEFVDCRASDCKVFSATFRSVSFYTAKRNDEIWIVVERVGTVDTKVDHPMSTARSWIISSFFNPNPP